MSDSHHEHEEAPSYDDINTPVIVLVGIMSAVITLLVIFFVQGLTYYWQNQATLQADKGPTSPSAVKQIEEQKAALSSDKTSLTIDEAMNKVVAEYKR